MAQLENFFISPLHNRLDQRLNQDVDLLQILAELQRKRGFCGMFGSFSLCQDQCFMRIPLYNYEALVERLNEVCAGRSLLELEQMLGYRRESIRRYLKGASKANAPFLTAVCERFQVSACWLLMGSGGRTREEVISRMIDQASMTEVAEALAERLGVPQSKLPSTEPVQVRLPQVSVHRVARPFQMRAQPMHRVRVETNDGDQPR